MPVLDVIANRLLESSMKGDLKAIQWVVQSDQEATANEMAKHGEAEDIGLPNKEALRKTSSQRTSSATVIPFRASANELSMTARNYGKDIPELWEGHPRIMGRTSLGWKMFGLERSLGTAMLVLEPIFEADLPSELYAYRPGLEITTITLRN